MILLLGGTSETGAVAAALAGAGKAVLVSTATDEPLEIGNHPGIRRRCGRLDESSMAELIRSESITAIVDATHPYAAAVRFLASRLAAKMGIPYFSYVRQGGASTSERKASALSPITWRRRPWRSRSFGPCC